LTEPRKVTVTIAGIKSLTILEVARATVIANVKRTDAERLLRTIIDPDADPAELERGTLLLYAWAFQLVKRDEPEATWQDAQTWRLEFDLDAPDDIAEAEAEARIHASLVSGLPPDVAQNLTLADMGIYAELAEKR
jgi:hypothetical protein